MRRLLSVSIVVTVALVAFSSGFAVAMPNTSEITTAMVKNAGGTPKDPGSAPSQKEVASAWPFFKKQADKNYDLLFAAQKAAVSETQFRYCFFSVKPLIKVTSQRLDDACYVLQQIPGTSITAKTVAPSFTGTLSRNKFHQKNFTETDYVIKTTSGWAWTLTQDGVDSCSRITPP